MGLHWQPNRMTTAQWATSLETEGQSTREEKQLWLKPMGAEDKDPHPLKGEEAGGRQLQTVEGPQTSAELIWERKALRQH